MDHRPSVELLESSHTFPGVYRIKVIGSVADDFEDRVLNIVREEVAAASDVEYSSRATPGGRHVALTLDIIVQSAEQVRSLYARIETVEGLRMVL